MKLTASQSSRPKPSPIKMTYGPTDGQALSREQRKQTMLKLGKTIIVAGFAFILIGAMTPVRAGSADEAKALGEKAVALIAAQGDKAFPLLSDPKGEYVKGDMYVT